MGYKDWGAWNSMADSLVLTGLPVYKINLSHNGTTLEAPCTFADLSAFGKGGYWSEYVDISRFLDLLQDKGTEHFILIGHSRGGGDVALFGQDPRVKQIHCIAPICNIEERLPKGDDLLKWKNDGVYFKTNGRTKQEMPHEYQQYEDFVQHKDLLSIEKALTYTKAEVFVYHGDQDESVALQEGVCVAKWARGIFLNIPGANHTFGVSEPWLSTDLPADFKDLIQLLKKNIVQHLSH